MRKVVSKFGEGPLQQKLTTGDLHYVSDAEVSKGGNGTGPSPHEFLGAALAACTSMTLKMYSERKSIQLQNAIVTVDIERHDDIEIFTRHMEVVGDLDDEQRARMLEIAKRCPIHKALAGEIQIKTQLVN